MKEETNTKKIFSIITTIIKIICIIALILLIAVLALQRFSNNEIAVGGFRIFNVATGSMVPKYNVGDVLIIKEVDTNKLEVGDDITYLGEVGTFKDRVVTHQIVRIEETVGGRIFYTKGIANDTEDPQITADQIYGKVIYKCVLISILTKLMNNLTAFYIIIFIPFALLIFLQIKDYIADKKENEEDDDEDNEEDEEDEEDDDGNEEDNTEDESENKN